MSYLGKALMFVFCSGILLSGCSGCGEKGGVKPIEPTITELDNIMRDQTREEWIQIKRDLTKMLDAQTGGDFETFVDYSHPRLVTPDNRDEVIKSMHDYWESGVKSENTEIELKKVSPIVSDSTTNYTVIWFDEIMLVKFDSIFKGEPSALRMMMNDRFGENYVVYDSLKREYTVDKTFILYAANEKGSDKWTFMDQGFISTPQANGLMDFEILYDLRQYEK